MRLSPNKKSKLFPINWFVENFLAVSCDVLSLSNFDILQLEGAKKEIFCTMARVEEIKSPREGDSCRTQNDRQTKVDSKPATAHLTRKCPDNSTNQDAECGGREETKNHCHKK